MIEKVLKEASAWVGYLEKANDKDLLSFTGNAGTANYTIFAKWYQYWWDDDYQAQPWCAVFVSVVFYHALDEELFPHFAYCPSGVKDFKKAGQWKTANPQAGDIIFYHNGNGVACHVGIVERVQNARVYTIEGNTSSESGVIVNGGCVTRKNYAINYSKILGYGCPRYKTEELTTTQYDELNNKIEALAATYSTIESVPEWAKPTILKLYNAEYLRGDENHNLSLTNEMIRIFVVLDRAGLFEKVKKIKLESVTNIGR